MHENLKGMMRAKKKRGTLGWGTSGKGEKPKREAGDELGNQKGTNMGLSPHNGKHEGVRSVLLGLLKQRMSGGQKRTNEFLITEKEGREGKGQGGRKALFVFVVQTAVKKGGSEQRTKPLEKRSKHQKIPVKEG